MRRLTVLFVAALCATVALTAIPAAATAIAETDASAEAVVAELSELTTTAVDDEEVEGEEDAADEAEHELVEAELAEASAFVQVSAEELRRRAPKGKRAPKKTPKTKVSKRKPQPKKQQKKPKSKAPKKQNRKPSPKQKTAKKTKAPKNQPKKQPKKQAKKTPKGKGKGNGKGKAVKSKAPKGKGKGKNAGKGKGGNTKKSKAQKNSKPKSKASKAAKKSGGKQKSAKGKGKGKGKGKSKLSAGKGKGKGKGKSQNSKTAKSKAAKSKSKSKKSKEKRGGKAAKAKATKEKKTKEQSQLPLKGAQQPQVKAEVPDKSAPLTRSLPSMDDLKSGLNPTPSDNACCPCPIGPKFRQVLWPAASADEEGLTHWALVDVRSALATRSGARVTRASSHGRVFVRCRQCGQSCSKGPAPDQSPPPTQPGGGGPQPVEGRTLSVGPLTVSAMDDGSTHMKLEPTTMKDGSVVSGQGTVKGDTIKGEVTTTEPGAWMGTKVKGSNDGQQLSASVSKTSSLLNTPGANLDFDKESGHTTLSVGSGLGKTVSGTTTDMAQSVPSLPSRVWEGTKSLFGFGSQPLSLPAPDFSPSGPFEFTGPPKKPDGRQTTVSLGTDRDPVSQLPTLQGGSVTTTSSTTPGKPSSKGPIASFSSNSDRTTVDLASGDKWFSPSATVTSHHTGPKSGTTEGHVGLGGFNPVPVYRNDGTPKKPFTFETSDYDPFSQW